MEMELDHYLQTSGIQFYGQDREFTDLFVWWDVDGEGIPGNPGYLCFLRKDVVL